MLFSYTLMELGGSKRNIKSHFKYVAKGHGLHSFNQNLYHHHK